MLKSKEKLLNLTKVFFKYFFALLGIIVSLILTLGIAVNLLELSNTGSLIGNFGFLIADKFYYYFGTPGLIISISGFIASARFLTNSENKEISKKIFFVLLITIATGGLFKIFKELFSIAEYKFIGFIPSKITAFLVKQITGYLGTTLFYLFILFFSISLAARPGSTNVEAPQALRTEVKSFFSTDLDHSPRRWTEVPSKRLPFCFSVPISKLAAAMGGERRELA